MKIPKVKVKSFYIYLTLGSIFQPVDSYPDVLRKDYPKYNLYIYAEG